MHATQITSIASSPQGKTKPHQQCLQQSNVHMESILFLIHTYAF